MPPTDIVKQQVAAHWGRRAAHFDEDFGHSIRTSEERAAWDRVFALALGGRDRIDALDIGCGTGFLSLELASRGHRVTGIDFAPAMLTLARGKAAEAAADIRFEEADAEALPFAPLAFDLVITRHVLWTLPHPEAAIDEWIRVLRPGGRLAVIDGQSLVNARRRAGGERATQRRIRADRRPTAVPHGQAAGRHRGAVQRPWACRCRRRPARRCDPRAKPARRCGRRGVAAAQALCRLGQQAARFA